MKKFEEMTDQELIDFCHENMLGVEVCKALGCEEWCKEQDCPMFQCLNRFENYIKDHPTEKGGEWMAKRFIDAEKLNYLNCSIYWGKDEEGNEVYRHTEVAFKTDIEQIPTADVVEVRHGEWVIKSETTQTLDDVDEVLYVECPFCQRTFYVPFEFEDKKILEYARKHYPYCHCGAKMDANGGE